MEVGRSREGRVGINGLTVEVERAEIADGKAPPCAGARVGMPPKSKRFRPADQTDLGGWKGRYGRDTASQRACVLHHFADEWAAFGMDRLSTAVSAGGAESLNDVEVIGE